ncbi:MAG: hypothetical protein MUC48_12140 [Leptolyngbya sp. Prado105]|jgi:hypothetical protein|nr:hypothetical protein [Leptolyngbya sp. Prado105]
MKVFQEVSIKQKQDNSLFGLGVTYGTATAIEILAQYEVEPVSLVCRHITGDWGSFGSFQEIELSEEEANGESWLLSEEPGKKNVWSLRNNGVEIKSEYILPGGETVWVSTIRKGSGSTIREGYSGLRN